MKYIKLTVLIFLLAPLLSIADDAVAQTEVDGINGRVYCDQNKDGVCDCEENGLKGIHIQLFTEHCGGTPLQTIHTDEHGHFSFHVHEDGTYFVMVDLDYVCGGRIPTTKICQQVEFEDGDSVSLEPFGYTVTGQ